MTVNEKSWHFRIASVYGMGRFYRRTNLCSYVSHFLFGSVMWLGAVFFGALAAILLVLIPIAWFVGCLVGGHFYWADELLLAAFLYPLALGVVLVCLYLDWSNTHHVSLVPSPVREVYRAWKDRYCPIIEITP